MVAKKYVPIGDMLSTETSYLQASQALDLAATVAVESRDTEALTKVAALYIELGSRLTLPGEDPDAEEEEEEHDLTGDVQIGFAPPAQYERPKEIIEDGRTNRGPKGKQAQGRRISRLHTQHGEL